MTTTAQLRQDLAHALSRDAEHTDPGWLTALEAVPRELFLGEALYRITPNGQWEPVRHKDLGDDEWLRLIYTDATWVTQVDGVHAADALHPVTGTPTSSSTLPSLVVRMLDLAQVKEGDKVLEIGTGTGYSTAILSHRLGDQHVYSVEYDPGLARLATARINTAGYRPHLITGDGLRGHQDGADYDAIIATCSVRTIPPSWLWQLSDGGSITVALSGWMLASGLIRLALDENGTARGRFTHDTVGYMLARPHERPPHPTFYRHPGTTRPAHLDPGLLRDWTGHFVAQLAAPSAQLMHSGEDVILFDVATGSQAWTETTGDGWTVHQHGPVHLWDQVEDALQTWQTAGAPDQRAFGMTASDAEQTVWLGSPDGPCWRLPF